MTFLRQRLLRIDSAPMPGNGPLFLYRRTQNPSASPNDAHVQGRVLSDTPLPLDVTTRGDRDGMLYHHRRLGATSQLEPPCANAATKHLCAAGLETSPLRGPRSRLTCLARPHRTTTTTRLLLLRLRPPPLLLPPAPLLPTALTTKTTTTVRKHQPGAT